MILARQVFQVKFGHMDEMLAALKANWEGYEDIHQACLEASETYGAPGNYVIGANIAGFVKVADAMMEQGLYG